MLEDISADHALKTVTLEAHPHIAAGAGLHASIHPCKHATVMQKLCSELAQGGRECKPEQYLFLFLKFISCVIPTVEYSADTDAPGASVPYGRATRTSPTCCVRNRRRRAACPQGPTYCTYWVRVPASAVRCRPCPVVITPGGVRPHHLRRWALISTRSRSDLEAISQRSRRDLEAISPAPAVL